MKAKIEADEVAVFEGKITACCSESVINLSSKNKLGFFKEIDGRLVKDRFIVDLDASGAVGRSIRVIYGGKGVNDLMSRGDMADVTYYGGGGADNVTVERGNWTIYPRGGQNTIDGFATRKIVIERPEDSSLDGDRTTILKFKPTGFGLLKNNVSDIIELGFPTRGLVPANVQQNVDKVAEQAAWEGKVGPVVAGKQMSYLGPANSCRSVYDKVMDMEELRDGDIVQIKCPFAEDAPKGFFLAVKNPEKTVVVVDLILSHLRFSGEDNLAETRAPAVVADAAIAAAGLTETVPPAVESKFVGQADQAWILPEGEMLPTT
jgi:hypothetical protein